MASVVIAAAVLLWSLVGRGGPGLDGPVVYSGFSFAAGGEDALIEGVLMLDGDCLYIDSPDVPGARYPAVWPHGTKWQEEPTGIILPGGEIALLGAWVSGGGGYHKDRRRIESVADSTGAELVLRCALGPHREVAIFNRGSGVETADPPIN